MKPILLCAILFVTLATTAGCGAEVGCPSLLRIETINLNIQDTSGQAIGDFNGTVTVAGEQISVDCPSDSQNSDVDSGDGYSCEDGLLTIYTTPVNTISADLQTADNPALVFNGDINLAVDTSFPDGEECGAYRSADNADVVLAPSSS